MKTRSGFVSNSSTSSFIILAVDISNTIPRKSGGYFDSEYFAVIEDVAERNYLELLIIDEHAYIGISLSTWDDDDFAPNEIGLNDLQDMILSTKRNVNYAGYNANNLKLYYGIKYS